MRPQVQPVPWRSQDSLEQLLGSGTTLYYRALDMPLQEWQTMQTVKVRRTIMRLQDLLLKPGLRALYPRARAGADVSLHMCFLGQAAVRGVPQVLQVPGIGVWACVEAGGPPTTRVQRRWTKCVRVGCISGFKNSKTSLSNQRYCSGHVKLQMAYRNSRKGGWQGCISLYPGGSPRSLRGPPV